MRITRSAAAHEAGLCRNEVYVDTVVQPFGLDDDEKVPNNLSGDMVGLGGCWPDI
jgi:hypothetical protein